MAGRLTLLRIVFLAGTWGVLIHKGGTKARPRMPRAAWHLRCRLHSNLLRSCYARMIVSSVLEYRCMPSIT